MSQLRVLVVGGSIAGLSTAYWFGKAGAHITVIERYPHFRMGGQAVDIRSVGVTIMRKIKGMEAAVRARNTTIEGLSFVRPDGRPYGTLRATGNPDEQSLLSEYEIFRGDLAKVIFDMNESNPNIKYIFGEQVAAMQQPAKADKPITVDFANGTPSSDFDLVVACDGATSRTRALGLGCGVRDHIVPTNSWAAYCSVKKDLLEGSKVGHAFTATGGRFVAYGPDPAGVNRVAFMGMYPRDGRDSTKGFRDAMKAGDESLKHYVAEQYKDVVGWKLGEAMEGMMESDDFYGSEIVQVKAPVLYKGRFVMVGDAGYAPGPTGGGTSLAMAGAYLLAGEITKHSGDLEAGLRGYEQQIRPLITDLQKIPPLVLSIIAPQTAWGIWIRNHLFGFICWTKILEFAQKYLASAFDTPDKFNIPEYEWPESKTS